MACVFCTVSWYVRVLVWASLTLSGECGVAVSSEPELRGAAEVVLRGDEKPRGGLSLGRPERAGASKTYNVIKYFSYMESYVLRSS